MTHDFANKPKPAKKPKKQQPKSNVPGWVWLFTGIVTGVFICFLAFLAGLTPEPRTEPLASVIKPDTDSEQSRSSPRFDFYTLLPERELIVPTEDDPEEEEVNLSYLLQAGSFKNESDADKLRAKLILLGLDANIEEVTVTPGDNWHRVHVGPFDSRSALAKAREILVTEGIDTLLLKQKP